MLVRDTAINVTIEGHKPLGEALGSTSFLQEFVGEKVDEWVNEVTNSQISPYHSLKPAMQPSLLVCGTVEHIS